MTVDLTIVIPCCNEKDNIGVLALELMPVVESLRQRRSVEVIFIDDGSTDGTGDALNRAFESDANVRVVRHHRNRGLGGALKTGFRYARGKVVITADADGTYPFTLLPRLLDELRADVDIVTASCYHPRGGVDNVPAFRIMLSRTASTIYRIILDRRVHTYTCLVRAYRRKVIDSVTFDSEGFLAVTELLANAILAGYVVRELPCTLYNRRHGSSKARIVQITLAHLGFQLSLVGRRLGRQTVPAAPTRKASRGDRSPSK